ncbi:MAG: hypothetical protein ABJH98_12285 [Reichenbachiella sp.]|uniref:hypothetical protein n=1 Tax=Reichenbachiella sp. TaxID=2184521 RepID=UPI00329A3A95
MAEASYKFKGLVFTNERPLAIFNRKIGKFGFPDLVYANELMCAGLYYDSMNRGFDFWAYKTAYKSRLEVLKAIELIHDALLKVNISPDVPDLDKFTPDFVKNTDNKR